MFFIPASDRSEKPEAHWLVRLSDLQRIARCPDESGAGRYIKFQIQNFTFKIMEKPNFESEILNL
ncbi:MAG: hypothetical protein JSS93_06600 [Bacteroidetes bacterium]|nr:hypothetical protein [Bacteroidota bacterium]